MVQRLIRDQIFRKDIQVQILSTAFMVSWLNRYSSRLESDHSEKISGFDPRAHRLTHQI